MRPRSIVIAILFSASRALSQNAAVGPPDNAVYLAPFSHLDFYWGGTREECLARGNRIIAQAIRLAKQSPRFRFLIEDEVFVDNFVQTHKGAPEMDDLKRLVKEGRIEITPKWAAIFQSLPDGEILARNIGLGKRYSQDVFGIDAQVAQMSDIPDATPQFPQILKQSRVPFMVLTRMGPSDHSLFRWKAPDGSEVLVWNTLKGYGWGTFLTSKTLTEQQKLDRLGKDLRDVRATTSGPIYMNWGTDLWAPPDDIVQTIDRLNQSGPASLVFATPSEFFRQVQKQSSIPELGGEINSSWPNIVSSLAHMWPQIIPATNTLLTAEKFATINYALGYADYPQQEFDFLWKKLIESMDHNHDGQGGAIADGRKIGYEQLAVLRGGEILRDSLRNIAERVQVPVPNSFPIVVFNPLSWTRDDLVKAHVTLFGQVSPADITPFKKGLRLVDQMGRPVEFDVEQYSENISRALQLVFIATDVPSLGYKTYYLIAADQPESASKAAKVTLDDERDRREPRRSLGSDVMENDFYRLTVDRATGRVTLLDKTLNRDVCRDMEIVGTEERGGNYIGIEPPSGRTVVRVIDDVTLEENNPIQATLRIDGKIADIPITQRLTLYHTLKRLDIENTVDWKGPRLLRIELLFPLAAPDAAIHYGVPFGVNSADNIMPNTGTHASDEITMQSWRRSRLVHDFLHAGTSEWGLTIATDHQQFRIGEGLVRAQMVRGTRFTSARVVGNGQSVSMHYPPPGSYVFRYALSSGTGDWKSNKAYRTGLAWNNPLLPVSVVDDLSSKALPPTNSFCAVSSENLVVSALKKADRSPKVLVRLYEAEGSDVKTSLDFLGKNSMFSLNNLLEEDAGPASQRTVQVTPFEIQTLAITRDVSEK
jgi:alpha-mannosidase